MQLSLLVQSRAVFKAILLTFEPLLAGPAFARCAFKGPFAGSNWTPDGRPDGMYIMYTYIRKILHSSTISVGLAQARPNSNIFSITGTVREYACGWHRYRIIRSLTSTDGIRSGIEDF